MTQESFPQYLQNEKKHPVISFSLQNSLRIPSAKFYRLVQVSPASAKFLFLNLRIILIFLTVCSKIFYFSSYFNAKCNLQISGSIYDFLNIILELLNVTNSQ